MLVVDLPFYLCTPSKTKTKFDPASEKIYTNLKKSMNKLLDAYIYQLSKSTIDKIWYATVHSLHSFISLQDRLQLPDRSAVLLASVSRGVPVAAHQVPHRAVR